MTLIEVLVASLIVAVIAVGTLMGINAADHSTANERSDAQAVQLAGQDEERLRSLTTTELEQFAPAATSRAENGGCLEQVAGAWHYWNQSSTSFCEKQTGLSGTAYSGVVYNIASSAEYVHAETGGTNSALTCEASTATANYIRTTSLVTWNQTGTHKATQSSIVTVPTSNTVVVKVLNQRNEAVEGANVKVVDGTTSLSRVTSSTGCAVFGGLPTTAAEITATKTGWVNMNGEEAPVAKKETLSKTATTEVKFHIAEPGGLGVQFFEAASPFKSVNGSTFYVFQSEVATPSGWVGGSASTYAASAELEGGKFVLFPFRRTTETPAGENPYHVFAGDCEANNPKVVTGSVEPTQAQIEPNSLASPTPKVYLPKFLITLDEGTKAAKGGLITSGVERAMIINKKCEGQIARTGSVPYKHEVTFSGGSLVQDFQPYATELEVCVVVKKGAKTYKLEPTLSNASASGKAETLYPEEGSTTSTTCP
jgi:type II secretory pathway pseudopilin PulG